MTSSPVPAIFPLSSIITDLSGSLPVHQAAVSSPSIHPTMFAVQNYGKYMVDGGQLGISAQGTAPYTIPQMSTNQVRIGISKYNSNSSSDKNTVTSYVDITPFGTWMYNSGAISDGKYLMEISIGADTFQYDIEVYHEPLAASLIFRILPYVLIILNFLCLSSKRKTTTKTRRNLTILLLVLNFFYILAFIVCAAIYKVFYTWRFLLTLIIVIQCIYYFNISRKQQQQQRHRPPPRREQQQQGFGTYRVS